jgi:hypothetical protein
MSASRELMGLIRTSHVGWGQGESNIGTLRTCVLVLDGHQEMVFLVPLSILENIQELDADLAYALEKLLHMTMNLLVAFRTTSRSFGSQLIFSFLGQGQHVVGGRRVPRLVKKRRCFRKLNRDNVIVA